MAGAGFPDSVYIGFLLEDFSHLPEDETTVFTMQNRGLIVFEGVDQIVDALCSQRCWEVNPCIFSCDSDFFPMRKLIVQIRLQDNVGLIRSPLPLVSM